ncbi:unnamed protein product [Ceutorhynchus assimilis]|uniref:C2H2-type domain-containing protein n=1 Tax=Ceutorhynchus assimilis TaxID=467358 RepID=A0A9N9MDY8_9CUCU|nr:unnamed protein product [Ceutorhynchus assimilis]
MTSVTIPSSTGSLHGGYPSVREELPNRESNFKSARSTKRFLSLPSTSDSCKKRRKQSTPIRIYNSEPESSGGDTSISIPPYSETKPAESCENICHVCQLRFDTAEQAQSHIEYEHQQVEFKREPEDETETTSSSAPFVEAPLCLTMPRSEVPWTGELSNKDWANSNVQNNSFGTTNPVFMAMSQFSQPDNLQIKPIRIFNPDAYCDLCNKEFCNKYFLKTHKANKHGIYTDVTTSEQQIPNAASIPSFATNLNLKLSASVPSIDATIKSDPKISAIAMNPYIFPCSFSNQFSKQSLPGLPNSELSDVQNPISMPTSNGPLSSSGSEKLLTEDPSIEVCSSPSNNQNESTSAKNESDGNVIFFNSVKMSPSQSIREMELSNRLRKIGVMNPKAFCEICNKEYCNKYFLRTHKMKRHGIYIPDDRDPKMEGMGNSSWPSTIQTSPLNLIVTEQSPSHDRKTSSPNDIGCEICDIKFQNSNLAQLHNYTMHGKMTPKENESNLDTSFGPSSDDSKKSQEMCKTSVPEKTEAISEDLQKLQTMILQLNDLDEAKASTACTSCNKEFENRFYLHAHMVTEHGMLLEDATDFEKSGDSENSNNNTLCDLCGKDLQNAEEMKKHILEAHSNISSGPENHKEEFSYENVPPDKSSSKIFIPGGSVPERRLSVNVTPTSSYCEICNKELCNKYFMKTHMQRMHGIEIENGAQIGGVVCDICNKELCSKYFLRVHKHNTHGIVEYGASLVQPRKSEGEQNFSQPLISTPEPEPALKPNDLADLSHRYFTHFTEVCPICSRRFRSAKWLKAHLVSDHGQAGMEKWSELEQQLQQSLGQNSKSSKSIKTERASPNLKVPNGGHETPQKNLGIQNVLSSIFGSEEVNAKSYQCSYCPFTSPLLPLLFIHERTHAFNENVPLKCPVCPQSFLERELFQHHMYSHHPFLHLPPVFNGHSDIISKDQAQQEIVKDEDSVPATVTEESGENIHPNNVSPTDKLKKDPQRINITELPLEVSQSLRDVAEKAQLPATYALPHQGINDVPQDENSSDTAGYVMQAFLLEESASDRRVVPSVVFLPMLQKQPAPLTVTFTLTPA